tara:strand:- start:54 stop:512 length:459 start_codon:yes stop_codon:yes gene_type:complete
MTDHRKPKFKDLHENAQKELREPLNRWLTIHLSLAGFKEGEATSNLCEIINIVHKIIGKLTSEYCSFGRLPDGRYPGGDYYGIPQAYYSIGQHAPRGKVEFYEDEQYYEDQGPWHTHEDFAPNTDDNICRKYILKIEDEEEVTVTENYGGTK